MTDLYRRRPAEGQPIAARLRQLVAVLWSLLLVVGVLAVATLTIQSDEVERLTLASGPAFDANRDVLQQMTNAETGLRGYEISHSPLLLAPYLSARAETLAALTMLHDKLALGSRDDADVAVHAGLERAQRLAVDRWWTHAQEAEQAETRGQSSDVLAARVLQGGGLFDSFRAANTALGAHIAAERAQARTAARTISTAGRAATGFVTLVALVVGLIVGRRVASSVSRPITELRDTVIRQGEGEGERGARAHEDQGSSEIRSLSAAFNALTDQNLGLTETQALGLLMHELTFDIERAMRKAPDPQQALDVLCAMLGEGLGVDRVMANTIDDDHVVLLGAQWHPSDLPPLGDMSADLVPHVVQLAEELWLSSERLVLNDFLAPQVQSREQARILHRETGARSVIIAPIGLGDRVIGVIHVFTVHEPREWTKSEANAVQQVAAFVARVIVEADYRAHQGEYVGRLERLDRQKTDFLSTVSHELRTPLTSISGYLELLQDGDAGRLTGQQHRMLEVMDRNTSRLRTLIEDLLVLNRIESGGLKVNTAPVSIRELITHAGEELAPLAKTGAIVLDIDPGPEVAIVAGDKGHLQRAVVNIVSNAIKFSSPGGVVTFTCTLDQGTGRVLLTCQDRGIGIPADDQGQLFTRFYRASNAQDQAIPGTGLGLTIVKQIVEDHGGELRLTSVEGEGTTVVMDLPLSAGAPTATTQTSGGDGNDSH